MYVSNSVVYLLSRRGLLMFAIIAMLAKCFRAQLTALTLHLLNDGRANRR